MFEASRRLGRAGRGCGGGAGMGGGAASEIPSVLIQRGLAACYLQGEL